MELSKVTILQTNESTTEEELEEFRKFLVHVTAHTKYENMFILLSRKKFDVHHVNSDTFEKMKEKLPSG